MKKLFIIYSGLNSVLFATAASASSSHGHSLWISPFIHSIILAVIAVLLAVGIDWLINRLSLSNHTKSRKNNHAT